MCSKYILEPCIKKVPHAHVYKDTGKYLWISGTHPSYSGDASWECTIKTSVDGEVSKTYTIRDLHNIEKAIIILRKTEGYDSIVNIANKIRNMFGNEDIPNSLVQTRFNSLRRHSYLDGNGNLLVKAYDVIAVLRGWGWDCDMPSSLTVLIESIGKDLIKKCA